MAADETLSPIEFQFSLDVYRLAAIKKAAYRFTDQFAVQIEQASVNEVRVRLVPRPTPGGARLDPLSFPNEVLDQDLREVVAEETKGMRDLLLAQVFSEFSVVDPVGETADFRDDPLRIAAERSHTKRQANGATNDANG